MRSHCNAFGPPRSCRYDNWHIRGRGDSGHHLEAKLDTEWRSLRRTIAGMIALTAFAGCSSLTGLTGSQSPPPAPGATASTVTSIPAPAPTAGTVTSAPASVATAGTAASIPPPQPAPPSPPPTATASASTSTSFTSRVKGWFTGDSGQTLAAAPSQTQASAEFDCPTVDYRQGAATLTINDPKAENAALSLKYQASFAKTARECDVHGDMVTIRVGVQGRVVVGPAGAPGTVTVPLRYALVREGIEPRTLWTKLFAVPVTMSGQLNVPFTHVEEEMTVPIPSRSELAAYIIYIGFDPDGLKPAEKEKPVAKPRAVRAR
jgi:hypothetical protein